MNLEKIEYERPSGYSSGEWNILDIWYDYGYKFICGVSIDNIVMIEKQQCDEILNTIFYRSYVKLDIKDSDDSIVFWCHKESKKVL